MLPANCLNNRNAGFVKKGWRPSGSVQVCSRNINCVLSGTMRAALAALAVIAGAHGTAVAWAIPQSRDDVIALRGPTCMECTLTFRRLVTIGGTEDPGHVGMPASVDRNSRGEWLITHQFERGVAVYDSTGQYLRTIGRNGEGPGEFRNAGKMHLLQGDTIAVFDVILGRINVYDGTEVSVATWPLPIRAIRELAFLRDGRYVINGDLRTREAAGFPLHLATRSGSVVRSFGAEDPVVRRDMPRLHQRTMGLAKNGMVWVGHKTRYRIEQYDTAGNKTRTLDRDVPWFPAHGGLTAISEAAPPAPLFRRLCELGDGLLLAAISIADSNWKASIRETARIQGRSVLGADSPNDLYDSMLEVIDVKKGQVLVSRRIPERVHDITDDGLIVNYYLTAAGVPYIEVWAAVFTDPTRGGQP